MRICAAARHADAALRATPLRATLTMPLPYAARFFSLPIIAAADAMFRFRMPRRWLILILLRLRMPLTPRPCAVYLPIDLRRQRGKVTVTGAATLQMLLDFHALRDAHAADAFRHTPLPLPLLLLTPLLIAATMLRLFADYFHADGLLATFAGCAMIAYAGRSVYASDYERYDALRWRSDAVCLRCRHAAITLLLMLPCRALRYAPRAATKAP